MRNSPKPSLAYSVNRHLIFDVVNNKLVACSRLSTVHGDSGGPLQCSRKDGRWFLAGITSFGFGCAKPGFPDVYTRLSYYLPWIRHQIHKHSLAE
ncbi:hypothetical protein J6590_091567 [Homalodisca vitripennis]|nr:hypothetical protein J6590_091567 [Homalodisca vitripennis]